MGSGNMVRFPSTQVPPAALGAPTYDGPLIPGGGPDSDRMQPIRNNIWEPVDLTRAELWIPLEDKDNYTYVAAGYEGTNISGFTPSFVAKKYDRGQAMFFHRPGKYYVFWDFGGAPAMVAVRHYIRLDASAHEFSHPGLSQCISYYDPNLPGNYPLANGVLGGLAVANKWGGGIALAKQGRLWILSGTCTGVSTAGRCSLLVYTASGGTRVKHLRSAKFRQSGTVAGGPLSYVAHIIEGTDPYSSGGNALTPFNPDRNAAATTPDFAARYFGGGGAIVYTMGTSLYVDLDTWPAEVGRMYDRSYDDAPAWRGGSGGGIAFRFAESVGAAATIDFVIEIAEE
jgi:hypothetical protein